MSEHTSHLRSYLLVYAALLVLLALTVGAAYVHLGPGNIAVAVLIAIIKASLVGWVFMHLRFSRGVVMLFALSGVLWLAILIGLTYADFAVRY